jgi:hypothetical protein
VGDYADDAVSQALEFELDRLDAEPDDEYFNGGPRAPGRPTCQYCRKEARLVTGKHIYPHRPDLSRKRFWRCDNCDAHVGAKENGDPRGPLANARLRQLRMEAHAAFDPYWKGGSMSRTKAYKWLADQLGITEREAHIGSSDEEFCRRVLKLCKPKRKPRGAR